MYCIVAVVIVFVIAESVFFFVRAWKRAAALNMDRRRLKKIVASTALYTVAPAVAILLGVIALSKALGLPLPWLRLSVIGALTYETTAAETAARAFGTNISQIITGRAHLCRHCLGYDDGDYAQRHSAAYYGQARGKRPCPDQEQG